MLKRKCLNLSCSACGLLLLQEFQQQQQQKAQKNSLLQTFSKGLRAVVYLLFFNVCLIVIYLDSS